MSDNGEIEVESQGYPVLPKEVTEEIGSIKLFNKVGNALRRAHRSPLHTHQENSD